MSDGDVIAGNTNKEKTGRVGEVDVGVAVQ